MLEENKALSRRWFEDMLNQGKMEAADEIFADNYFDHDPNNPFAAGGREGMKTFAAMYRSVFPDLHMKVEDVLAEGDKSLVRWTATGTQQGELMGIPPTGKSVSITGMDIFRISDGKIVESWTNYDLLGMLQQLGAIPAPGQ